MTPEGRVKQKIKEYLTAIGAYYFMPVQMGIGAKTVDFLVCHHGRFIGIEAKAPGKKATPLQKYCMLNIREAGGIAFVADDIEIVKTYINA